MIKHLQVSHTIILETIARKSPAVKKKYKERVKPKKEPVLDPETGLIKKNVPTEVRKKRRKPKRGEMLHISRLCNHVDSF